MLQLMGWVELINELNIFFRITNHLFKIANFQIAYYFKPTEARHSILLKVLIQSIYSKFVHLAIHPFLIPDLFIFFTFFFRHYYRIRNTNLMRKMIKRKQKRDMKSKRKKKNLAWKLHIRDLQYFENLWWL